jgi:hypothetical protein
LALFATIGKYLAISILVLAARILKGGLVMSQSTATQVPQQNITRENHFLPVCYQQSFTNYDGELCVQFLDKDKPIYLHPSAVGKINDFYTRTINGIDDDGIEQFFMFVEGQYASVARRIKEDKNEFVPQPDEIAILLKFVITQIVRTQAHRFCIDEQAGAEVPQGVFIHNMLRKMKMIADRWVQHCPDIILWTTLPHLRSQFLTGDNPVLCFCRTEEEPRVQTLLPAMPKIVDLRVSLESSDNGFVVPLSPYICLTVVNSGDRDSVKLRPPQCTDPNVVRDVNRLIYNQCVQFVAAQDAEFLRFHMKKAITDGLSPNRSRTSS